MNRRILLFSIALGVVPFACLAQPGPVAEALRQAAQPPGAAAAALNTYLLRKAPRFQMPAGADQWTAEARRLRQRILNDIVFRGWPREWIDAPPRFEDLGLMPSGPGYRMRKLRYEIVPGFYSTAILYEPERLAGKVPAVLNVHGHGAAGKAIEFKQKRCINQALQGILALNLEWIGFGELGGAEYQHRRGAYLDLVGANDAGLFYLAMRKGLDYLWQHPNVDRARIGLTGLSGGGWQTIILSALDERVSVSIPVAGYSTVISRLERQGDIGDLEQNATDLLTVADFAHLTAMRAPKPTLLIYNAEDDCCFRAPLVKPYIFDAVRPLFRLFGKEDALAWHENTDPGTHNYQLDNRVQSYRFFTRHFGLPPVEREIPVDAQIKSQDELAVGLPKDNLNFVTLARKLADRIERSPAPSGPARAEWVRSRRAELLRTLSFQPVKVRHAWALASSKRQGIETRTYRFEFDNGLNAAGTWLRATSTPDGAPATVILHSNGRRSALALVDDRIARGEQVLALDLLFTGDAAPDKPPSSLFTLLAGALGDRPLGLEAAQLSSVLSWMKREHGAARPRMETVGIRTQVAALAAAALDPGSVSEMVAHQGMRSLRYLLDAPVDYNAAPDLFCLDLYRNFDLDVLAQMAAPVAVSLRAPLEAN